MAQLDTYDQSYDTDAQGQIFLTGVLNAEAFNQVNVEIVLGPHAPAVNMTVTCTMGELSGTTVGAEVGSFPLGDAAQIHTYNVVGPQFSVIIVGGPPSTAIPVQGWVFMK